MRGLAVIADRAPQKQVVVAHSMGGAISLEALRTGQARGRSSRPSRRRCGASRAAAASSVYARSANALGFGTFPAQPEPKDEKFEGNPFTHDFERWGLYRRLVTAEPRLALGEPTIGWVVASLDVCARILPPRRARSPARNADAGRDRDRGDDRRSSRPAHARCETAGARVTCRCRARATRSSWKPTNAAHSFWKAFDELCAQGGRLMASVLIASSVGAAGPSRIDSADWFSSRVSESRQQCGASWSCGAGGICLFSGRVSAPTSRPRPPACPGRRKHKPPRHRRCANCSISFALSVPASAAQIHAADQISRIARQRQRDSDKA